MSDITTCNSETCKIYEYCLGKSIPVNLIELASCINDKQSEVVECNASINVMESKEDQSKSRIIHDSISFYDCQANSHGVYFNPIDEHHYMEQALSQMRCETMAIEKRNALNRKLNPPKKKGFWETLFE